MDVQVNFKSIDKSYSYDCINKATLNDKVIILEGALVGREGTVINIGRGDYPGMLYKCWRPEFSVDDFISQDSEIQV